MPPDPLRSVVAYMVGRGFAIAYRDEGTATFTRPKKPSTDIGCLLLLLGIVPGLLYFGLFRGTQTTTLAAVPSEICTQLLVSGDDYRGRRELADWIRRTLIS